jgi:type IV pilus assembly protein PilF
MMGRVFRLGLACLIAGWLAGCANQPGRSKTDDSPVNLQNRGPDSDERKRARIRVELAAGYYQNGQVAVALDELKLALEADPSYQDAYNMLGLVYMELGEHRMADESFLKALRLAPNDSEVNNNYGWYLCQRGREAQSIPYFLAALKNPLYATPGKPLTNAGICALRIKDLAAAESYLVRAFEMDPGSPVTLYNLGQLFLQKKEYERAKFYVGRLNTAYEPTAQTLWLAIRVAQKMGDRATFLQLSDQLRRRFPGSAEMGSLERGAYDN